MIDTTISAHIAASPGTLVDLYADATRWPRLFPATIRGARIVEKDGAEVVVEVDHRYEGRVMNRLRRVSALRVDLDEWKPRYDATFSNEFSPEAGGTRYTLRAQVRLKGAYRLLALFVKPLVRARMRQYVIEPLRAAAEARQSAPA